jgi:hypothetical protein
LVQNTKIGKYIQDSHKYTKWANNIPPSSIARPYKIYPNRDFWFENMPSGNPGATVNGVKGFHLSLRNGFNQGDKMSLWKFRPKFRRNHFWSKFHNELLVA